MITNNKFNREDLVLVLKNGLGIPVGDVGVVKDVYFYPDGSIRYWCESLVQTDPYEDVDWSCEFLESSLMPATDLAKAIFLK